MPVLMVYLLELSWMSLATWFSSSIKTFIRHLISYKLYRVKYCLNELDSTISASGTFIYAHVTTYEEFQRHNDCHEQEKHTFWQLPGHHFFPSLARLWLEFFWISYCSVMATVYSQNNWVALNHRATDIIFTLCQK